MSNNNVIDLKSRARKSKAKGFKSGEKVQECPVLDMVERREAILSDERRRVRRTILSEFVGAFAVVPGKGLIKVAMYDISEDGMAFDLDVHQGHFNLGEDVAMRVYLNQKSYFPFVVKLQNLREIQEEGVFRHGVNFAKGTINETALHHFVKFIETVSADLEGDNGDILASIS